MSFLVDFNTTWFLEAYNLSVDLLMANWTRNISLYRMNRRGHKVQDDLVSSYVLLILPYAVILLLAILGNSLVIVTLVVNKRMRTVTNVFLLNMALSDLLLGVFCMPFTLAGVLLRAFVFGELMCKMIPYAQAVSVSVGAWTLVSMSVERYHAICHPLKSRLWQTVSHAKRMIAIVWCVSLSCMLPIAILSELQPSGDLRGKKYKCRERWPSEISEQIFNILIDIFLLIVPLVIMMVTYSLIISTLWKGITQPILSPQNGSTSLSTISKDRSCSSIEAVESLRHHASLSSSHNQKSLTQKRRVIKMLFVVVIEFFVCWTPLHVINTISLFDPESVYAGLGYHGISFFQLLAYTSSCCNPITYCFMNSKFRSNFLAIFGCQGRGSLGFSSRNSMATTYRSTCSTAPRENTAPKHVGFT